MSRFADPMLGVDSDLISLLSPEEQLEFHRAAATLVGAESLREFVERIAPHEPVPHHLEPLVDVIQYSRLRPVRVCVDIAPGHAKTTMIMRAIAWWLSPGQSPGDLCGYVSYSDGQARDKSRVAKEAIVAGGSKLMTDKKSDSFWMTPQGGGLKAAGSQGGLTGKRIPGLLAYDDPYKNMQEARSQTINSQIIERFRAVAFTRLQGGSIIVVHTRWSIDDLIGWILKNHRWDSISIPAVCVDAGTDMLGREKGDVAWPEKYPYELCLERDGVTPKICGHDGHLREIEETLGDHIFQAMYGGNPRPEGTRVFREPARYRLYDCQRTGARSEFAWTGKRGVIAIDPAATEKTSADWSVLLVMASEGFGIRTRIWIVDCVRRQVEIPALVQTAYEMQVRYRLMVACEAVAGFKAVPQSLRAINPRLRVLDVEVGGRDKFTRAQPLAAAWNAGRVLVPIDAPWADKLIDEFTRFTGARNGVDDQVDAGSNGFNVLYRPAPKATEADYASGGM